MAASRTKVIQKLNDRFRMGDVIVPGTVVVTSGVQSLLAEAGGSMEALMSVVGSYDDFTEGNDPHGEHDFGKISFLLTDLFWKIDQYNTTYDGGSEDPTVLSITCRVLTIMLTEEY
ncbi:DUF3768 domain-containing protein [Parasedimentitalea psychrophila]|uniref:DUF3768 domain-containing protein n=1 Tax=Parasedimentitalea psychrophila TaxID=2997337 RepID=A0A9Y2KWK2_9RHOB|nr:DUF3768 domain-containing protein [Parasedimentitalea psychrophila]WIY23873.1 DUF3768 domain-containing protein [Parasedimentitalea psychrophila]